MDISFLVENAVGIGFQGLGRKPKTRRASYFIIIHAIETKKRNKTIIYCRTLAAQRVLVKNRSVPMAKDRALANSQLLSNCVKESHNIELSSVRLASE